MEIDLLILLGQNLHFAGFDSVDGWSDDLVGVHEPLVCQHRLDDDLGTVAKGLHDLFLFNKRHLACALHAVFIFGLFDDGDGQPFIRDLLDDLFAGLKPVQPAQVIRNQINRINFCFGQRLLALGHGHGNRCRIRVGGAVCAQSAFGVHQTITRNAAALGDCIVVKIVGAGDFHGPRAEFRIRVFIRDDRDQPSMLLRANGNFAEFSYDWRVTFI